MATDPRDQWTMFHFSQSNTEGAGQDDVPALLRRIADSIEALGDVDVFDITYSVETTDGADRPSMSVYYNRR